MTRDQEKRRDNFMRLARMANFVPVGHFNVTDVFLAQFAEMVAAEEREACAKLCEEQADSPALTSIEQYRAKFIADAIRAR